jgi:serine protease AprX
MQSAIPGDVGSRSSTRRRAAGALATLTAGALASVALGTTPAGADTGLGYDPIGTKGALYNIAEVVGAHAAYSAGITGKGVGVALIDTGVAPVQGLTSGNVVNGPDLSFDSQDPQLAHLDAYGHGTHLASIIAGRDVAGSPSSYLNAGNFTGIAPDATLLNVKVGASDGAVDVTQVIAGIDWVVEHAKDNGMNIRVINLSYGTDSVQDSTIDPLAFAVENAWKHGIVVVAAGGNDGDTTNTVADPARDPFVLAVGALDDNGTVASDDDSVPSWSTNGDATRHVDVVAPGVSVLGLRVPSGYADERNPQARVGDRFAKASGTSQAAAVVSGEAALLLQSMPWLTPDQVKSVLMGTAGGVRATSVLNQGNGRTDLRKAMLGSLLPVTQRYTWSTGTGSIEAARGSSHVDRDGVVLQGEVDIFGNAWNAAAWASADAKLKAWDKGQWRGYTLTGDGWADRATWRTADWTQTAWDSRMWRDADWESRMWRDNSWTGDSWSSRMWRDAEWSSRMWRSEDLAGVSWT